MKFCHGTSYDCALEILRNGFGGYAQPSVWNCSFERYTYAWVQSEDDMDGFEARFMAAESGIISAAKYGSFREEIVVFTFEMSDEDSDEWAMEDDSCPNMDGAYCFHNDWLNESIRSGVVKLSVEAARIYEPGFRWLYLTGCSRMYMDLSKAEKAFVEIAEQSKLNIFSAMHEEVWCSPDREFGPLDIASALEAADADLSPGKSSLLEVVR